LDAAVILVQPTAGQHFLVVIVHGIPIVPPAKVDFVSAVKGFVVGQQAEGMFYQRNVLLMLRPSEPADFEQVRFGFCIRVGQVLLVSLVRLIRQDGHGFVEQANLLRQVFGGRGHMVSKSDMLPYLLIQFRGQIVSVHDVSALQHPVVVKVQDYLRPKRRESLVDLPNLVQRTLTPQAIK